jgi:hypothetical protein
MSLLLQLVSLSRSLEVSKVHFHKRLSEYTLSEGKAGLYKRSHAKNLIDMRITRVLIYNILVEIT